MPTLWNCCEMMAAYCRLIGLEVGARSEVVNIGVEEDAARTGIAGNTSRKASTASIAPAVAFCTTVKRICFHET